ncbi:AraC family transcriptional regulator [Haloferula sp.]|uniref:helix-turn-helix transcriptional regulator n=1 Tax=Haloferula sp. TaxID=2497595 RepID=UPI00329E63F2
MNQPLLNIEDPVDYYSGKGTEAIPTPMNILLFMRRTKQILQQKAQALQDRSHHRFVLIYNLETEGHLHVNQLAFSFSPGQAVLISPYQFHHYSHLRTSQLKWLFCTFELKSREFLEPLRNRVINPSEESMDGYEQLLLRWHDPKKELSNEKVQAALIQLLLSLKQARLNAGTDLPQTPDDNLLQRINRMLTEHTRHPMVIAALAEALHMSESSLRAKFKTVAGVPIGAYIQNYRINRAMALLSTTGLSIADVAEEIGCGSPQAFSRIFRNQTGQSPRTYRKKGGIHAHSPSEEGMSGLSLKEELEGSG